MPANGSRSAPWRVRLFYGLRNQPDFMAITDHELLAMRDAQNRTASSPLARLITGFPARGVAIEWQRLTLPDRALAVRVCRPAPHRSHSESGLPLVVHVHGGGFVGTAVQCDWLTSHLASRLPAVVVSVEHRLVSPDTPFSDGVSDGWDALQHLVGDAQRWGVDAGQVAVVGESAGGAVMALAAIRARACGLRLRAQVLVNPCVDLTSTALEYASMREPATTPTITLAQMELFRRLAVPPGADAGEVSPLYAGDLSALAPALIVTPALDPLADQGRAYADRLRDAGTTVRVAEYPEAGHAFVSMPHLVPAARPARREILAFLRDRLPSSDADARRRAAAR